MAKDKATQTGAFSLTQQIRLQIKNHGPMSLSTYMRLCLTHPEQGYYKTTDPLGTKGDFVTAPEISQMFGEMLGAWVLMQWHILECPKQFNLIELGPGRGTLMSDTMRVIAKAPDAMAATNLILLETNPVLIEIQRKNLGTCNPQWISEIDQIDTANNPNIILANEFFDALPIKQFQFQNNNWHERLIGLKNDNLTWGLSPTPIAQTALPSEINNPEEDAIWEICQLGQDTLEQITDLLNQHGGAMLIIDYGYEKTQTGDTFQAIANHGFADPLENPGAADLSAHVDFDALINVACQHGAISHFLGTQKQFLTQLGIKQRAEKLIAQNPAKAQTISADLNRLIGKEQMGELFKVMTVFGVKSTAPFERCENLSQHSHIAHGFFGRRGGSSSGSYSNLNVSMVLGDNKANVMRNRSIALMSLDPTPDNLITLSQVHSTNVIPIDKNFDFSSHPKADGMVTNCAKIGLGILTADCTPILFSDPEAGIIGACHAGWRGAVDGIITNTLLAMQKLGADPGRIAAAIGPTIWPQNYEVGPKFAEEFLALHPHGQQFILSSGKDNREHFDLPGFVNAELCKNRITNISRIEHCTYANPQKYFSHRFATHGENKTGRQISIIVLK